MSQDFYDAAIQTVERPPVKVEAEGSGSFWRKATPELAADAGIEIGGMFEHQREWWDLKTYIKVLVGGYAAGKTISLSKRAIALALENAPCPVACVSPTYGIARQTTIATISELLQGKQTLLGRSIGFSYNQGAHEFKISYKGRTGCIIIYSGDNPLSLRGPNLAAALIDEPFIQDEEVFKQMIARVRHPMARHREIGLCGTPEQLNWGWDLCEGELSERHDVGVVHASTKANLALPGQYIESLEATFADREADAYIGGGFVNLSKGQVYYAFDRTENVVKLKRPPGSKMGAGMDFNVNPMAFCTFWVEEDHRINHGAHIHFTREYEQPNSDTEYACQTLKENHWDEGLRDIWPDPAGGSRATNAPGGKTDFHYIKAAGFDVNARASHPKRKDRFNAANGKFKARNGRITCTVDPSCKQMIKYLSTHTHEMMKKQESMTHLLDAMTYPIEMLFPVAKEIMHVRPLSGY